MPRPLASTLNGEFSMRSAFPLRQDRLHGDRADDLGSAANQAKVPQAREPMVFLKAD